MLKYVFALIISSTFFAPQAQPQTNPDPGSPAQVPQVRKTSDRETIVSADIEQARQRLQQELTAHVISERQVALRRDTEKLASLASELKQSVDRTNANILSMEVIKKAQEIQKLAKSVQDKMKNAY